MVGVATGATTVETMVETAVGMTEVARYVEEALSVIMLMTVL